MIKALLFVVTSTLAKYANTNWPKCHRDAANTASTPLEGLSSKNISVQTLFDLRLRSCLGVYTDTNGTLWGTSETSFFKLHKNADGVYKIVDTITKDISQVKNDIFYGIYSFISDKGVYYSYVNDEIIGVTNSEPKDPWSPIEMKYRAQLPFGRLLAIGMVGEHVVFVTDTGTIGAMDAELSELLDHMEIGDAVTNAFAVDRDDNIYVLSAMELVKMEFVNGQFKIVWRTKYDYNPVQFVERPSKKGSGTTPSIMEINGDSYIAIGNGSVDQSLLMISAKSGEVVASQRVEFIDGQPSYTEQSLTISGNKVVVVQNAFTDFGNRVVDIMKAWNTAAAVRKSTYHRIKENSYLLPVVLGDNPVGYAQFEFDPTRPKDERLKQVWHLQQSCPNAIPTISESTKCVYCVGKVSTHWSGSNAADFVPKNANGMWSMECIDLDSGRLRHVWPISPLFRYNSLYAGTQILDNGVMAYGTLGGVVIVQNA